MATSPVDNLSDWVDPDAIRTMVDSVRDAFDAAPVWARVGLLFMPAFAVVTRILRVASIFAGRLVAVAAAAGVAAVLWFYGSDAHEFLANWWP